MATLKSHFKFPQEFTTKNKNQVSAMTDSGRLSSKAFSAAYNKFFDSLSSDEKARFPRQATEDDLFQSLRVLQVFTQSHQKRKLSRTLDVVKSFSDRLKPYFAIL